ncbi:MAG: cell envelope integrity protein TolA [Pseudomonadota bacterium]|nr:cell envelope integrity protein TolA [Pseudomonadota bacterium]
MNNTFNNLVIYNGYPLSVVVAVAFHSFILVFLIWLQSNASMDSLELVQPTIIRALIIDENPQVRNERIQERQRLEQIEQERIVREEQQRQLEEEAVRQAELERQLEEAERDRQALIEREELERQRLFELERQREREQQELEEQRQRELVEAESRRQEEADLRRQQEASAAQAARTEFELVQSATAIIQMAVQQVWNRPPSARNGMRAILQISMLPTGELLDARITESSGDAAFDRSAENAVYSAAPFTELQSLPINVFNTNFRTLSLIFQPEDLLN